MQYPNPRQTLPKTTAERSVAVDYQPCACSKSSYITDRGGDELLRAGMMPGPDEGTFPIS